MDPKHGHEYGYDLRIESYKPLIPPQILEMEIPMVNINNWNYQHY